VSNDFAAAERAETIHVEDGGRKRDGQVRMKALHSGRERRGERGAAATLDGRSPLRGGIGVLGRVGVAASAVRLCGRLDLLGRQETTPSLRKSQGEAPCQDQGSDRERAHTVIVGGRAAGVKPFVSPAGGNCWDGIGRECSLPLEPEKPRVYISRRGDAIFQNRW
jgi:hypothetical protein